MQALALGQVFPAHPLLPVRAIVQQVDIAVDRGQWHLGRKPVLWPATRARLMHQGDACYVALWGPTSVERALIDRLLIGVKAEFDHTEWYRASNEDIASTVCE